MASKITVGKVVANATETGWSQAYHAGGFTAVLSVTTQKPTEEGHLAKVGKKILDGLVAEYFTLTSKDLGTVKGAVLAALEGMPEDVSVALTVAATVKNVLYAVIANEGRVLLRRGDKLGMLLGLKTGDSEKVASVSGFLEHGDVILLHTPAFAKVFSKDDLEAAFDHKSAEELGEYFAPKVHEAQDGAAAALVFAFQEDGETVAEPMREAKHETTTPAHHKLEPTHAFAQKEKPARHEAMQEEVAEKPIAKEDVFPGFDQKPDYPKPKAAFSHRQKLFLTITVILGLVLLSSIVVFQVRQNQAKQEALFASLYNPAKSKFSEAQGLLEVNKAMAIEDLQNVISQLQTAQGKFSATSNEEKQITALLTQAQSTLADAQKVPVITATKAPDNASPLLSFANSHTNTPYFDQNSTDFFTADNNTITAYSKTSNTPKKLTTNGGDWSSIGGFQVYYGNLYVLDTKAGIIKYASGSYDKSQYFSSATPDLSKAVSMAIDGSVWILSSDGTITKYTKGVQDNLSVSGLDTQLKNPTQILTSIDLNNVYILDKGNGRVVVLKKDGSFVAQYASSAVSSATLMDVSEKNKEIYLLSGGTIYQLDMK